MNDVIEISDESSDDSDPSHEGPLNGIKRKAAVAYYTVTDSEDDEDGLEICVSESESEPEIECEFWDDDCIVLDIKPTCKPIHGFHLMPTCERDPGQQIKKLKLSTSLNSTFTNEEYFTTLKDNFNNDNAFEDKNCEILRDPWKVLILNNVLSEPSILDAIRNDFNELEWNTRRLDLYEFFQSLDIKNFTLPNMNIIYEFLKCDLKEWVSKLFGMELSEVSATCSFYGDTDFLLVHDDQTEDRAIAFVLYLTGEEGWSADWGGSLQLFNKDEDGQPSESARNILPRNNQLVLFPVSDHSYHQVEEVRCKNYCRLSINGWFHTKEPLKFNTPLYEPPIRGFHSDTFVGPMEVDADLKTWSSYSDSFIETILYTLESESEISLESFFKEDKLNELEEALKSPETKWEKLGPSNRRNYELLSISDDQPKIITDFINLFKSEMFFEYIGKISEIDARKMKWDLQRWTPGSYCLFQEQNQFELDLFVFFGDCNIVGGTLHYVTLEDKEQEALLSLSPSTNCLHIVYSNTPKYISYVSKLSKSKCFYVFIASYLE